MVGRPLKTGWIAHMVEHTDPPLFTTDEELDKSGSFDVRFRMDRPSVHNTALLGRYRADSIQVRCSS